MGSDLDEIFCRYHTRRMNDFEGPSLRAVSGALRWVDL